MFEEHEGRTGIEPRALQERPVLSSYEAGIASKYLAVSELRREGVTGPLALTLLELDLYLQYHPVADTYYFIDLMVAIDRYARNNPNSQTGRAPSGAGGAVAKPRAKPPRKGR